jgi:hypothetical protein
MTIVNDKVRICFGVWDGPQSTHAATMNLLVVDSAIEITMAKQTEAKEGMGDVFGEEHSPDTGWDVGEGVSHAPDNDVLEYSGVPSER